MKVAILLTTYNSAVYIDELIQSLIDQTYKSWTLYVRDDLSTDVTRDKLKNYARLDDRIHILQDDIKRGAKDGFFWLLEHVEADYYMFCDHDDVWKRDKIKLTLEEMLRQETAFPFCPIIVHTDLEIVDSKLSQIAPSYWENQNFHKEDFNDKYLHLAYNNVTGCTMMINQLSKEVSLPPHTLSRMHDAWVTASVLWHDGRVVGLDEATILYRQHGDNTIGANEVPNFIDKFRRIGKIMDKVRKEMTVAKYLSGMDRTRYLFLKLYFMMRIYQRRNQKRKCYSIVPYPQLCRLLGKMADIPISHVL